jgi:TolA-binding protein
MKRILIAGMALWLGSVSLLQAQSAASAAADRQAADEINARLTGKIQDLSESQDALNRKIEELQNQIKELRDQQGKPNTDVVQRDELRKLAEQVKDIDEKRQADKEMIVAEIKKLGNIAATPIKPPKAKLTPVPATTDAGTTDTPPAANANYEGYEHTVKSGETLIAIIRAYNKEYDLKLTLDQVLKHPMNAKVKPEKLAVGQKVFIPAK